MKSFRSQNQLKSSDMRFATERAFRRSVIKAELILTRFWDLKDTYSLCLTKHKNPKLKLKAYSLYLSALIHSSEWKSCYTKTLFFMTCSMYL